MRMVITDKFRREFSGPFKLSAANEKISRRESVKLERGGAAAIALIELQRDNHH